MAHVCPARDQCSLYCLNGQNVQMVAVSLVEMLRFVVNHVNHGEVSLNVHKGDGLGFRDLGALENAPF